MMQILMISFLLPLILIFLNSTLAKKTIQEREKPSSFECGFDPKSNSRTPFSLRFFLIALIFLIFDVEITLILPIPMIMKTVSTTPLMIMFLFFILILIMGLAAEWKEGALEWK